MFDPIVFEQVRRYWIADQEHPHRGRSQNPIPELGDFAALIETSFVASIQREEGRFANFALTLLFVDATGREQARSGSTQELIKFATALPLIPDAVTKLSPACDHRIGALAVSRLPQISGGYGIWGLLFFGRTTTRFDEVPVSLQGFTMSRPDLLTVTAVSPGSLLVSRGIALIGRFILGKFTPARPTPFVSGAMGAVIIDSIRDSVGYQKYGNHYWHVYRDALEYLLSAAAARGHGGTIIVVPRNMVGKCEAGFQPRYGPAGRLRTTTLIEHSLGLMKGSDICITSGIAYNGEIATRLDFLAQLSCIDGALLISEDLEVIDFGTTLRGEKWQGKVVIGPDGLGGGGEEFDLSRLGTRHNAAANFVGRFPHCYGFVVSQDGPIRGFVRKDESTLYCWPDCMASMFV